MEQISSPRMLTAHVAQQPAIHVCLHARRQTWADVRVMRNAMALMQVGFTVSIVDLEPDSSRPREEELDGARITHIVMPGWFVRARFKPWFLAKLARLFARGATQLLKTPADIYHACDLKALPACYIAARLRRKPLIFETYELPLDEPAITRRRWLYALAVRVLRSMMPYCAGVIAVSPPIVRELQQRYGGKTAVLVRNIPIYQAPRSSDRLRRFLGLSSETRIALYQGNLQADRTLDVVIRAAKYLAAGIVLVMLGQGEGPAELEALIAREGVSDRVKLVPAVPYAELLEWTASADLGLAIFSPSYSLNVQMCLPNKLFEYLMAGVPVLASSLEAVTDVLKTYDVGCIVPSLEPEEVGCAISAMLADREGLARMRRNALTACERELRWDVEGQRLIRLYQDILALCPREIDG